MIRAVLFGAASVIVAAWFGVSQPVDLTEIAVISAVAGPLVMMLGRLALIVGGRQR